MKAFGVLLLLALNAFILCDVFLLSPQESLLFKPHVRERFSKYVPALKPWLLPDAEAPAKGLPPPSVPPPVAEEIFVPPAMPSLDSLTQNWQTVPGSAFPRQVTLTKEVVFQMPAGSARLPAGAAVTALAFDKGSLTLAPTPESSARASLQIEATDFATQIARSYEEWKTLQIESARRRWERQRSIRQQAATMTSAVYPDGKPQPDATGAYPLLLASMNAGDVTEITPQKVIRWGRAEQREVDGQPTWCVNVEFKTIVYCGPIDATAQAQVRNGKVIAWIFPGSGEPVP